jgi:hypothetical protein
MSFIDRLSHIINNISLGSHSKRPIGVKAIAEKEKKNSVNAL